MPSLSELPPHIQKYGPWSISKLGTISQCSLKFDWKYGPNKQKEPETGNTESSTGIIVHRALELALWTHSVKQAFQQALAETPVLSDQEDTVMSFYTQVERTVAQFAKLRVLWGVKDSTNSVMIERKWGLTADFTGCEFFAKNVVFRGVVDYALLTSKNNLVIVDHKTGKKRSLDYYDAQFKAYCLLALSKYPELNSVQTAVNFVMSDKVEWSPAPISAEQIRDEYRPWLLKHITESCAGLGAPPKPTVQSLCDWCGYKPTCPAHGGDGRGPSEKEQ